jgi:hypothetical protein
VITITPDYISITDWAARTGDLLTSFGTIPTLMSDYEWREWAGQVASLPAVTALGAPRPEGFADFREWAVAFNAQIKMLQE